MLTRREVLKLLGAAGAGAMIAPGSLLLPRRASAFEVPASVSFDPAPFTLGVASGYPTTDSVTLWTRLAPNPVLGNGGIHDPTLVRWAVGDTPESVVAELGRDIDAPTARAKGGPLSGVVASGTTTAVAESGHSVHVEAAGLAPAQTYYYGFAALGTSSVIGRTRTAPAGPTDHLRFAVASCQNFAHGLYPALGHIADHDIDFVLFVGDYIYESGAGIRGGNIGGQPRTLDEYRVRHAMYKGDPNLRRAHANHPWLLTWDDHEVTNNYAGLHLPSSVAQLRTAGYQAYYEHLPIRLTEAGPPNGPFFRIHQEVAFGDLLDVALLDTRQYRDPEPCSTEAFPCPETYANHPDRTMLGAEQRAWLKETLASSTAAWRALGNPIPFAQWTIGGVPQEANDLANTAGVPLNDNVYFNNSAWHSYDAERRELLQFLVDEGIGDVVNLAGESHRTSWSHIRIDMDNPTTPIVLPDFGGTAISSNSGETTENDLSLAVYATTPEIRYLDSDRWGYMVCDVTPDRWRTSAWTIEHSTNPASDPRRDPAATKFERAVFEVLRGDPSMHHVAGEMGNPFPG